MTRSWEFTRLALITVLVTVATAVIAVAAPGAQADVLSCATTGAIGPIIPGAQSVLNDMGDGALNDTDNHVSFPTPGWEDGVYEYHDAISRCLALDTDGPGDDGAIDTGVYSAAIDSFGAYDNVVCGTGLWTDRGAVDSTTVDLTPIVALGPGEDIFDATYQITFAAGTGPMQILALSNLSNGGETLTGDGIAHILPVVGNCVTTDVTEFGLRAAFTLVGVPDQL